MQTVSDIYQYSTRLEDSLKELYSREQEFGQALEESAIAEHVYKMKQAREYLAAEGTEKARAAQATVACEKEHLTHVKTEATRDFTKEKLRDSQQALSARQSLLTASVKSDLGYANDRRTT